jgi:hypothetical protein
LVISNSTKIGLAILLLAAAGFLFGRSFFEKKFDAIAAADPYFMCRKCKEPFPVSADRMREAAAPTGAPITCPKCGGDETRSGVRCKACQGFNEPFGHGGLPEKCVKCGAAIRDAELAGK